MNKNQLLKKVKALGYPMFKAEETIDVNETLAEVVKSGDIRLWEGFPVMLANSLEKGLFDYEEVKTHLEITQEENLFHRLVMMSLALYDYLELELSFADKLYRSDFFDRKVFYNYLSQFKEERDLSDINGIMSSERVVNSFKNYFKRAEIDLKEVAELQDEFELEYAMSQIFPKKQKEIFLKKLKGEKLTKTEREYYSRSIKKKVLALANPDLHKLASKL
jgi:hypothetical protein